ncbi:MAG: hypothetical protein ACRER2_01645 [Methylococcales bacterium]
MQNWIESEFFGYWKDVQTRITKNLFTKDLNGGFSGPARIWEKPATRFMCRWGELVVRQSLELQSRWIDRWTHQLDNKTVDLPGFSKQVQLINHAMHDWSDIQEKLWKFWFDLLDTALEKTADSDPDREKLEVWKKVIKESEADLNHWFTKWEEQINCKPLVPDELNRLIEKLGREMLGWIQNQAILWQYGFDFVNSAALINQELKQISLQKSVVPLEKDDLTAISGIGPVIERMLNEQNIVSFRQIANLTDF